MKRFIARYVLQLHSHVKKDGTAGSRRAQSELEDAVALKAALVTPTTCTSSAGKSSTSSRRNISGRCGGGGIRARSIFGEGFVCIGRSCFVTTFPFLFTSNHKGFQPKHPQSLPPPH